MAPTLDEITFSGPHGLSFSPFGSSLRQTCPVCGSAKVRNAFRLPMARIEPPLTVFGGYFNEIPILRTPFKIYGWDLCEHCNSIFLNPTAPRERVNANYRASTSYLKQMERPESWRGHEERYDALLKFAPDNAKTFVDAACGGGHSLFLGQRARGRRWDKLVGLELSAHYVENLRNNGIEAHQFDLDRDDHRAVMPTGSADLVSFQEAFEHVQRPLAVVAKLLDLLRPGGRLYFSAQRYGNDVNLAILAGEPIYVGPRLIDLLPQLLPCTVVDVEKYGPRYLIAVERTAAPVTAAHLAIADEAAAPANPSPAPPPVGSPAPAEHRSIVLRGPFQHETGYCWMASLEDVENAAALEATADCREARDRSPAVLLEDGATVGPAHTVHDDIRTLGAGRFSHWGNTLYFSTTNNSDPNVNGRGYVLRW